MNREHDACGQNREVIKWTVKPTNRFLPTDLTAIETELKSAIGSIQYEESLVKSSTAPLYLIITVWLGQNAPLALLGVVLGKIVDGLIAVGKVMRSRAHLSQSMLGSVFDFETYTIEIYTPADTLVNPQAIADVVRLGQSAVIDGINTFGINVRSTLQGEPSISPGATWPKPIRRIVFKGDSVNKQYKLIEIDIEKRGAIYVPT